MAKVMKEVYDRPSMALRKVVRVAEIVTGNVPVILRKKWVRKPSWDHFVMIHYVEFPDGFRGWMDPSKPKRRHGT